MSIRSVNEVDIWTDVINPDSQDMSVPEANAVLRWSFNNAAKLKMEELAVRNGRGVLSESEMEELEAYVNVGQIIAILQAKARSSLKSSAGNRVE